MQQQATYVLGLDDDPTQDSHVNIIEELLFVFGFLKTKSPDVKFHSEQDHSKLHCTISYEATT
jgi:hypothetical protein